MFRFIFDYNGHSEMDAAIGESDINTGDGDTNFTAAGTCVLWDGSDISTYKGVSSWIKDRVTSAVTR